MVEDPLQARQRRREFLREQPVVSEQRGVITPERVEDFGLREGVGYGLFRDAGVVAPRTAFAWLTVNGKPQGLFVVVEEIDDRFVAANFPDGGEGNLYKEVWPTWNPLSSKVTEERLLAGCEDVEAHYLEHMVPEKNRRSLDYLAHATWYRDFAVMGRTALALLAVRLR